MTEFLLFRRLPHLLFHSVIQILRLQLAQRVAWRFEVIRQLPGEHLVDSDMRFLRIRRIFLFSFADEYQ
jgi:hypothetical protein